MKNKELSRYIAFLRHNFTNYDDYVSLMYDENGRQTEFRKYVNRVLYEISMNMRDADSAFRSLRHTIKQKQKDMNILRCRKKVRGFKPDETKKGRIKHVEKNRKKFVSSVLKFQEEKEKREREEEERVHKLYRDIMLSFVGLDSKSLKKKLIGG